jgi:hypothetical protein
MIGENISNAADKAFADELASIVGVDLHVKSAAAKGTPEEKRETMVKRASHIKKASDMSMPEMLEHEDFRRGIADEVEAQRSVWEPMVTSKLFSNEG